MSNAFYFTLKAFFVLKIFNFLPRLFGYVEKTAWFFKYYAENKAGRLVQDLLLFLKKA